MATPPESLYRQAIVAVFRNDADEILICERASEHGIWQFPQGGIEPGETARQAAEREIREELGTTKVEVLKEGAETSIYLFSVVYSRHIGQEAHWFLCRFLPGAGPALGASDGTFRAFRWVPRAEALSHIVEWKREAFRKGFRTLGLESPSDGGGGVTS